MIYDLGTYTRLDSSDNYFLAELIEKVEGNSVEKKETGSELIVCGPTETLLKEIPHRVKNNLQTYLKFALPVILQHIR